MSGEEHWYKLEVPNEHIFTLSFTVDKESPGPVTTYWLPLYLPVSFSPHSRYANWLESKNWMTGCLTTNLA